MYKGSCHCGAVTIEVDELPKDLGSCNCSICRRLGALFGYYTSNHVKITKAEGATMAYIQGDKMLEMHHCATCGCTTHWEGVEKKGDDRMAINARLLEPKDIKDIPIRLIDGASW